MTETFPAFNPGDPITSAWANAVGDAIERIIDHGAIGQIVYKISAGTGPATVGWANVPTPVAATRTNAGIAEIATETEITTGTDDVRFVTPLGLKALTATTTRAGLLRLATQAEVDTGTAANLAVAPSTLANYIGLGSGGTGATANLTWNATTSTVENTGGTNAILTVANGSTAGLMSASDYSKLESMSTGAGVVNATSVDAAGAVMNNDTTTAAMQFVIDQDDFISNLNTKVPTQQSVKAYIDAAASGLDARVGVLEGGGTVSSLAGALVVTSHSAYGSLNINWAQGHYLRVNSNGINIAGLTQSNGPGTAEMFVGFVEIVNTHGTTTISVDLSTLLLATPVFQVAAGKTALIKVTSSGNLGIYAEVAGVASGTPTAPADPDPQDPGTPTEITFNVAPQNTTIVEGGSASFNWAATSPTGAPLTYQIETEAGPGSGTGGSGWWNFGTQTGASFTFYNVQLSDNNTKVRITARDGVAAPAYALAMIYVTATAPVPTGPVFFDDFNRANNTNIATGSTLAWVESDFAGSAETAWAIVSNRLELTADYYASAIAGNIGGPTHYAECKVGNIVGTSQIIGPLVRSNSNSTQGYAALAMSDRVRLFKSNGVYSPVILADTRTNMTLADGFEHTVRLEAESSTLRVYVDGVLELTTTDPSWPSGQFVGVYANGPNVYADDFSADTDLTGTGGGGGGGGTTGLTISNVYFAGHSLMKQGYTNPFSLNQADNFQIPSYIATSCTNRGFTAVGVYAQSGGTVSNLLSNLATSRTAWQGCDTILMDTLINGDESAADFLATARQCNAYIRSYVPAMNIIWMEGHSLAGSPTGGLAHVLARWQNKNPTLYTMFNAGEIQGVVPWAAYAHANPSVYSSDGVHHWDDQAPYANFMTNYMATLTSSTEPTPTPDPDPGVPPAAGELPSRHRGFDSFAYNHFGNPLALTGPGNVHIKTNKLAMPFKAAITDQITHAAFNIKYNNNGYSGGTMGKLRCELQTANANGSPTGTVLASFTLNSVIAPDGNTTNGHVGKHAFSSPGSVTKGNNYALVISNVDAAPTTNFFSINLMVEFREGTEPWPDMYFQDYATGKGYFTPWIQGSSYWNPDGGADWNNYNGRTGNGFMAWHNSCFEVWHAGGTRQGQNYVGARYGDSNYERMLSGTTRFRVGMRSLIGGRKATHLCYRSGYSRTQWPSGTVVGAIVRNAAGSQLATCDMVKAGGWWGRGALSSQLTIAADTTYLVDIYHKSGTAMMARAMQTSFNNHGWSQDGQSNLPGGGIWLSTNGGSSFSQPSPGAGCSLSLFMETVKV